MKNMKTISLSAAAVVALLAGGASVSAAETDEGTATPTLKKSSIAEFTVDPGALTLDKVPNMHFKSTTVQKIATEGDVLVYQDAKLTQKVDSEDKLSAAAATSDVKGEGLIQVSDFRGTGTGWKLSVALGEFTNGKDFLKGTKLSIVTGDQTSVLGDDGSYVVYDATKAANKGTAVNTFTVDGNSSLTIPKTTDVKKGTYQADLTWTLANAATTRAAQ